MVFILNDFHPCADLRSGLWQHSVDCCTACTTPEEGVDVRSRGNSIWRAPTVCQAYREIARAVASQSERPGPWL